MLPRSAAVAQVARVQRALDRFPATTCATHRGATPSPCRRPCAGIRRAARPCTEFAPQRGVLVRNAHRALATRLTTSLHAARTASLADFPAPSSSPRPAARTAHRYRARMPLAIEDPGRCTEQRSCAHRRTRTPGPARRTVRTDGIRVPLRPHPPPAVHRLQRRGTTAATPATTTCWRRRRACAVSSPSPRASCRRKAGSRWAGC